MRILGIILVLMAVGFLWMALFLPEPSSSRAVPATCSFIAPGIIGAILTLNKERP